MPAEGLDPLHAFRFQVDFRSTSLGASSGTDRLVCQGAFSEVSGLEATMEPMVISEGGRSWGQIQRVGRTTFSTVILKRGLTTTRHLWDFFQKVNKDRAWAARMTVKITLQDLSGEGRIAWTLERAMPVKLKLADLNATNNEVGVEELHLVHEGLTEELLQSGSEEDES
ncbi:MAG TPA: phage tail protein [Myxococcota bacterium]|nr:phage tail protein [Myxococcota bacterium]HND29837.1 phage tail protein [Myxococcota bacterium]HNH46244.1 phage tail protein [Myxococcota bacterium]